MKFVDAFITFLVSVIVLVIIGAVIIGVPIAYLSDAIIGWAWPNLFGKTFGPENEMPWQIGVCCGILLSIVGSAFKSKLKD